LGESGGKMDWHVHGTVDWFWGVEVPVEERTDLWEDNVLVWNVFVDKGLVR